MAIRRLAWEKWIMDAPHTAARELMKLPMKERRRLMAAAARLAADDYNEDLKRPVAERELTAFTALDGEPVLDEYISEDFQLKEDG
jgi:hypothetical protein